LGLYWIIFDIPMKIALCTVTTLPLGQSFLPSLCRRISKSHIALCQIRYGNSPSLSPGRQSSDTTKLTRVVYSAEQFKNVVSPGGQKATPNYFRSSTTCRRSSALERLRHVHYLREHKASSIRCFHFFC
jgi:hypothetical protein